MLTAILIVLGTLAALGGLFYLTNATQGVGLIGFACFLGIMARLTQAKQHTDHIHDHLIDIQEGVSKIAHTTNGADRGAGGSGPDEKEISITPTQSGRRLATIFAWLFLLLAGLLVYGFMSHPPEWAGSKGATATTEYATINATDEYGDPLPGGTVNVWDDYATRKRVVARCQDGDRVIVLGRAGNGVRIRTGGGVTGWVSEWFVQ